MRKVVVRSVSRIHITLIDLHGGLGRVDGGIGFALNEPKIVVNAEPFNRFVVKGDVEDNIRNSIDKISKYFSLSKNLKIEVKEGYKPHLGLGFATQLCLSSSFALLKLNSVNASVREVAKIVGRGGTSGIGVACFQHGGFILDLGHRFGKGEEKEDFLPSSASKASPAPILTRLRFPENWYVILTIPYYGKRIHSLKEVNIFKKYCPIKERDVEKLSRIILMKLLPSLIERSIERFGEAIDEIQKIGFKRHEVEIQKKIVKDVMREAKRLGAFCSGLSSFGPTVYSLTNSLKHAKNIANGLKEMIEEKALGKVIITKGRNKGAEIHLKNE